MNTETQSIKLSEAIGYEIAKLLPLKFGKDGRTNTSWGTKSIEGLGNCILRIVEDERQKRLIKEYNEEIHFASDLKGNDLIVKQGNKRKECKKNKLTI